MAIEVVIGNVGSGKTYYATWRIWQEVKKIYEAEIKGYDYKYKRILTNIEGIQPNKYVKLLKVDELIKLYEEELKIYKKWEEANSNIDFSQVKFDNKLKEIDIEAIKNNEIVERFPNHDDPLRQYNNLNEKILDYIKLQNDKELAYIEYTKPIFEKAGYTDCLIVIDEAHNYFKALSAAKERLVSYHRHYDQDYILITQDLKQLSRKVLGITQKTIKAINPIVKGRKSFVYKVYSGGYISYNNTNLLEKIILKADPDIFKLYHSGSSKQQKSYLLKILAKPLMFIAFVVLGIIYLLHSFKEKAISHSSNLQKTHLVQKKKKEVKKKKKSIRYQELITNKIGNFYIYNGEKYYWIDFKNALEKCEAKLEKYKKNLDSTYTIYYKIRNKKCLENYLSSLSSL